MVKIRYNIFLIIILFSSCKASKNSSSVIVEGISFPALIIQDNYKPAKDNGLFNIISVEVKKDLLTLNVQYSGGCQEHEFKLYTNKNYAKSEPPKLTLSLEHNSNGDLCKSIVSDTLVFDISNAKYPGKEKKYTVNLLLDGYNKEIIYKY